MVVKYVYIALSGLLAGRHGGRGGGQGEGSGGERGLRGGEGRGTEGKAGRASGGGASNGFSLRLWTDWFDRMSEDVFIGEQRRGTLSMCISIIAILWAYAWLPHSSASSSSL